MALKKRGFNVDRILNQQREERLRLQAEKIRDREKHAGEAGPAADAVSISSETSLSQGSTAVEGEKDGVAKGARSLYDKIRNRRNSKTSLSGPTPKPQVSQSGGPHSPDQSNSASGMPGAFSPRRGSNGFGSGVNGTSSLSNASGPRSSQTTQRPTSLESIRNTVQKAVDASRPETSTQISDSRQAVRDVSESQDDYCDTSAQADLKLAIDLGESGLRMWIPRGWYRCVRMFNRD